MPLTNPHANTIPARAPSDKLFVIRYSMSGPGANVNSTDVNRKYPNFAASNCITSVLRS